MMQLKAVPKLSTCAMACPRPVLLHDDNDDDNDDDDDDAGDYGVGINTLSTCLRKSSTPIRQRESHYSLSLLPSFPLE